MVLGFTGGKKEPEDATLNKYSLVFSFQELQKATENFSRSKRMGEGGFGAVYRGMQPDGTEIAVKELQNARESGFEDEVRVLSMFRHPNLVVLMGFARNGPKRFLVYELMEGGDLFNRIHKPEAFPWRDRICVAYDAACGLSHLHHQTPKVFHRDIKSPNILLTRSGLAKVADFGLARICKMGGAQRLSDFGGTPGYMCPIYEKTQVITERSENIPFKDAKFALNGPWHGGMTLALTWLTRKTQAMSALGLCLIPLVLLLSLVDLKYFVRGRYGSLNLSRLTANTPDEAEVAQAAKRQFRELRRSMVLLVLDACGVLGNLMLAFFALRILAFGKDSLSSDEIYHTYSLMVWQSICAIFHSGILEFGDREMLFFLYAFNLLTFSLAFSPEKMLEPFVMIGRIIGSIAFLDFRHSFCINVIFSARRLQVLAVGSAPLLGQNVFVSEVCVTACILIIPWAIENLSLRLIFVLLSANEMSISLQAIRTVMTSSSDAQGELDKDLRLMKVSAKLAHFFRKNPCDLEGQSILTLLEKDDQERFQSSLQSAYQTAQRQGQPIPCNLNVSGKGRNKDLMFYACSLPFRNPDRQYYFAICEGEEKLAKLTRDGEETGEVEDVTSEAPKLHQPRLTSEALAAHSWAMPVSNCSSLWEVKVQVDEASLEVQEITIALNTNHWKKSRKTFLHECILPGVWDDFKRWIAASLKGRPGGNAIACARHVELKRKIGSTGRSEISLRLKHIFARRSAGPGAASLPPVNGLSTMSHESY
eukprot:symbB.v1.2.034798.t1/scaffold4525.1/size38475/3